VWDKWFPKPVKIIINQFMEKDMELNSHWFERVEGQWIQGLIATHNGNERRAYIVTILPVMETLMPCMIADHVLWGEIL